LNQKYLFENTDNLKFDLNYYDNSASVSVKKNQYKTHPIISFFGLFLMLLLGVNINAQSTAVFTANGTWTCPANVTSITVEAWGAGAGGKRGAGPKGFSGGGGGGGAYARLNTVTVIPGTTYTLTVGGVSGYDTSGNPSTATFGTNTITAAGGSTGGPNSLNAPGGAGGTVAASSGDVRFPGGDGGSGVGAIGGNGTGSGGGGGSGAGNTGNGNYGSTAQSNLIGGAGGAAVNNFGGAGGKGGDDNTTGGTASGTGYGGGGGGAGYWGGQGFGVLGGPGQHGAIIITYILPNGPGGVTNNLQLWLRSDLLDGTTTVADNSDVTTWYTQALGSNATKPASTGAPKYKNNSGANINFNAVVDFTNDYNSQSQVFTDADASRQYLKGPTGFYSQDLFVVLIPDIPVTNGLNAMDIFCGDKNVGTQETDATGIGYGKYTNRINDEVLTYALGTSTGLGNGYGVADKTTPYYSSPGIINARNNSGVTAQELYFNGNNVGNFTSDASKFTNISNSQYWIGRSEGWTGSLDGRVAEVITYSSRTTDTQRSNIRSYLAIKYGITLGANGVSTNYTNSAGTAIWDAAATGYNYDIAGIGRDDITKLTQKQSKSINTTDDITIGLGTIAATNTANTNNFDTDKKFLVWGNNHATLDAQSTVVNLSSGITIPNPLVTDVSFKKINRIWKVLATGGDIPSCKISIPTTMLATTNTPAVTPGDYMMFISNSSTFDATSEARIMTVNESNLETDYNFTGTKYITFGFAPEKTFERCIQFDGINDYLDSGDVLNLNTSFTVSAWVNRNGTNQTILSKRNNSFTQGYDLSINSSGKAEMSWYVGGAKKTITSNAEIPPAIWHHVGVTFDGTTAKMYIDGVNYKVEDLDGAPTATTDSFLIGAADGIPKSSFFKGSIDEVRIWKVALTDAQFRYVMNQEIVNNANLTNGVVVPNTITLNDISSIAWTNLSAYYPMSTYSFTNAKDKSSFGLTAALKNINTVDLQTAPLPYESDTAGNWDTAGIWKNNTLQDLPYSSSIEAPPSGLPPPGLSPSGLSHTIDWNIVRIKNSSTVTSIGNKKVLGLIVETGSTIKATTAGGLQTDGSKIEVTHYLKLDGKIDLVGRSQLVQTEGSDLDPSSSGSLERDQQGQSNKYNYNYWSSPVGTINTSTNNKAYTVGGVLRDGTDPAFPGMITWINGYDGKTSPFSLARYWIFKFDNLANNYSNWTQIGETGTLQAGKGFTLKGAGTSGTQNLTFVGKPNNGTITNTVSSDQLLLVGNPYPSALDADKFIDDNIGSIETSTTDPAIDGALYFWEHYSTNSTHNLKGYQGGYGIYNKSGGVAPSSIGVDYISGTGTTSKLAPKRYIPVGQGFFVVGNATGGPVTFKNSQREYIKEDNTSFSQTTYKIPETQKTSTHWTDHGDTFIPEDAHKKVRLGLSFYNDSFHRQVLLAFMDEKANSEMNAGYDAFNIDDSPSDMYLLNGENELAIQGEGYFNKDAAYPVGVRSKAAGKVSFVLDGLENFEENQAVFIYDKSDDSYHDIKESLFEVEVPQGAIEDRFYLRFNSTTKTLGTDTFEVSDGVIVIVNQKVTVSSSNEQIKNIDVFDMSGRKIDSYKKVNSAQFTLNHLNKTSAGLIVKITLDNDAVVSKKIIY